jgi:hypothetical protein
MNIIGLGGIEAEGRYMHASTIKAAVNKKFKDVKIIEVKKHKFGMFSVIVSKEMPKSVKKGYVFGEFDGGVVKLDNKITWS